MGEKGRITIPDEKTSMVEEKRLALEEESPEEHPRTKVGLEEPEKRVRDFREVEKGFTEEEAIREAVRCLRCDLEKELMEAEELEKLSSTDGRDHHD
jgi:NADH-quinone oxidoreductase subunit F